jgi:hypothetical protein
MPTASFQLTRSIRAVEGRFGDTWTLAFNVGFWPIAAIS